MRLSQHQMKFAFMISKLITWANMVPGYSITLGEAWRPPEMVAIYVKKGIGIKSSLHPKRLASDLNLFIKGRYQTRTKAYKVLGDKWKEMDPKNRWGGDFHDSKGRPKPDGNHFEYYPWD